MSDDYDDFHSFWRTDLINRLRLIEHPQLAKRLREGRPLLKHERLFLADLVEGKKRPRHRPRTTDAELNKYCIAELFLSFKASSGHRLLEKEIAAATAKLCGVTPDYVRRVTRELSPQQRKMIEKANLGFALEPK